MDGFVGEETIFACCMVGSDPYARLAEGVSSQGASCFIVIVSLHVRLFSGTGHMRPELGGKPLSQAKKGAQHMTQHSLDLYGLRMEEAQAFSPTRSGLCSK